MKAVTLLLAAMIFCFAASGFCTIAAAVQMAGNDALADRIGFAGLAVSALAAAGFAGAARRLV